MKSYREYFTLFCIIFFLFIFISIIDKHTQSVMSNQVAASDSFIVVIDAGHGGFDSGKVGIYKTLEKDLNLNIAKKLEKLLLSADVQVIMTRKDDQGLYEETSDNKKRQDMINRINLINKSNADCVVSIHQNSYPEESVNGAQVFYYTGSQKGKTLAALIQQELVTDVDPSNHRVEKSDASYYLLKNSAPPMVIVECGFLSNSAESKKLVDDAYQDQLAWAIHMGILQYLNCTSIN